ncbi:MAG TPA: RNA-binding protein [Candidatus Eisenbergiella merdigallinarum]|uniref:RNA-binding protein n=1 Tax=Candidatus Eisenbergiella merdigallinarum TaxID=2838552 RepID=A0A9D2MR47_9FIRM|nr:RNA-binding protein [Candidatus Eisenbergiella merdigallinarum]
MLELGKVQELIVVKKVEFGVYLAQREGDGEKVLLPARQVPRDAGIGSRIEVFLYKDSKDRLISTTARPRLTLGEVAELTVVQTGKLGAFLDWGLEKDLFLPFREQTRPVREGERFPAALYVDKSGRLCATMKLYPYLRTDSPYRKDDRVSGYLYEVSRQFGGFVAVDGIYSALIPAREVCGELKAGTRVEARVTRVHEDGKLDLSLREKAWMQIGTDAQKVMEAIRECGGELPFTDKASPDLIREKMGMSKNEFKRAVGHLLKEGKVRITETAIRQL